MNRRFRKSQRSRAARNGLIAMVVLWLNLALAPCAMAIQVSELEHDCCPSALEIETVECCVIDDIYADKRDDNPDVLAGPGELKLTANPPQPYAQRIQVPPEPNIAAPPLYIQHCAFLK